MFTTLAAGALSANAFRLGTAALDADDRILYDAATGALYYDKDGTGVAAAIQFATLDNMPATLNATDFLVILKSTPGPFPPDAASLIVGRQTAA